jgi:hypothetical protein
VLEPGPPPPDTPLRCLNAFRQGLSDMGYREGQHILLEYHYAEFKPDRLSALAAEVVRRTLDVIWTHSNPTALRRAQPPYGGSRAHSRRGVSTSRKQWDAGTLATMPFVFPIRSRECTPQHASWGLTP